VGESQILLGKVMAKKPAKLRPDVAETAFRVMLEATGQAPKTFPGEGPKNPDAVKRGRKGGKKGGTARAARLSKEQRTEIAKLAAATRWKSKD
jgi:hypothetical protein